MSYVTNLFCRECHREYEAEAIHVCEFCFGPLEVKYDYEAMAAVVSRETIAAGPLSIWRYKDFLPVEGREIIDISTGYTPLIRADRLGAELGLESLYLKNDTANPTYSFKDRVVSVALTKAREFGYETVSCASTGNLANSVAAYAAKAGFRAYIFIPADLETGKIVSSAIYAPSLVGVKGSYDDVNRLCSEIANEFDWAFVNINIRPYYAEGSKTLAYETAEQLGWELPDHVVVPVASGSLLTKIDKGMRELVQLGLVADHTVRISGAQAEGCAPVVRAFKKKTMNIQPLKPDTIAKSLAIGNPADGFYALKVVKDTRGKMEAVSDKEIVSGMKLLAQTEGIFAETAGGVTIGVLKKLAASGAIDPKARVVAYITGTGLKTIEAVDGAIAEPLKIEATLADFKRTVLKGRVSA